MRCALALLVLLCTLLLGCDDGRALRIDHWTLDGRAVVLPIKADVPDRADRFVLRTHVELPDDLRGQTLTLAIPQIEAKTELAVDGARVLPLDAPGGRSPRFRIEPTRPAIDLALTIENDTPQSAFLSTIPRLSATPWGDARFRATKTFDLATSTIALGALVGMFVTYAVLYLLDRRRKEHGWIALAAIFGMSSPLLWMEWTPYLFGRLELVIVAEMLAFAGIAVLAFTCEHFGLPRPSRGWMAMAAVLLVFTLFTGASKPAARVASIAAVIADYAVLGRLGWVLFTLARRRPRPADVLVMCAALAVLFLSSIPTALWRFRVIHPLEGVTLTPLGMMFFLLLHSLTLSRAHVNSAKTAEALVIELAARVEQLETKSREATVLTQELKRQIADRSQKLADALSRIEGISSLPRALKAGEVVDERYLVIKHLGSGGMGAVMEVERLVDRKRFALKVLRGETTGAALSRFAREAEIAARLDHPNLVSVVDVDVAQSGALYIVMELVDGVPLEMMRERYGDAPFLLSVLRQVAEGLAALHEQGVIHRDLKPGNVLVDARGHAKISDFGIASLREVIDPLAATHAPDTLPQKSDPLTLAGAMLGTPLFMAPELWRGADRADAASDVFSFGLVAYVALTGKYPYPGPPIYDMGAGRAVARAEPIELVSPAIRDLFTRCLSLDPRERPSAADLAAALA
ncbi:MAG: protein kinase domain-containing protein [Polyangiales bacterium]